MSLRDQLLKAGVVSKKEAQRAKRELKEQRKKKQGKKKRKGQLAREEAAAEAKRREAEEAERLAERKARDTERARHEAALRVRNLILGNRMNNRGNQKFFVRGRDGRTLHRLGLQPGVVNELARGRLAIALLDHGTSEELVIIGRDAAQKIAVIDPSVLLHFVSDPAPMEPDEGVFERDWEPSLEPHRVTED